MKLSDEQEKIFWAMIAKDLIVELSLEKNPKNWRQEEKLAIETAMNEVLIELCEQDKDFQKHINIDLGDKHKRTLNLQTTIDSLFIRGKKGGTNATTKNRFTLYLHQMLADKYIGLKGIQNMTWDQYLGTLPPEEQALYQAAAPSSQSSSQLPKSLSDLIGYFEYRYREIKRNLRKYTHLLPVEEITEELTSKHREHIGLLRADNRLGAYSIAKEINILAREIRAQIDAKNTDPNLKNYFAAEKEMYMMGGRLFGRVEHYISPVYPVDELLAAFDAKPNKTQEDYLTFYRHILGLDE